MGFKEAAYTVLGWGGAAALVGYPAYQLSKLWRRPSRPSNGEGIERFLSSEFKSSSAGIDAKMQGMGIEANDCTPR